VAWKIVDRNNIVYREGNFFASDVIGRITPKWAQKVFQYNWIPIELKSFAEIREIFNAHIAQVLELYGSKIAMVAFNAAFDRDALNLTSELMLNEKDFITEKHFWIDLWGWWCASCPKAYSAKINNRGRMSTTLESIYRYEFAKPKFKKRGTAKADMEICRELFFKVLRRKQTIPYVTPHNNFPLPWKILESRL
jgi:hypothetical protein